MFKDIAQQLAMTNRSRIELQNMEHEARWVTLASSFHIPPQKLLKRILACLSSGLATPKIPKSYGNPTLSITFNTVCVKITQELSRGEG